MPRYQSGPSPAITALLSFSLEKSFNSAATISLIWSTERFAKRGLMPPCRYSEPLIFSTALSERIHLPYFPLGPNSIRCSNQPRGCSASHFFRSASLGGDGSGLRFAVPERRPHLFRLARAEGGELARRSVPQVAVQVHRFVVADERMHLAAGFGCLLSPAT